MRIARADVCLLDFTHAGRDAIHVRIHRITRGPTNSGRETVMRAAQGAAARSLKDPARDQSSGRQAPFFFLPFSARAGLGPGP